MSLCSQLKNMANKDIKIHLRVPGHMKFWLMQNPIILFFSWKTAKNKHFKTLPTNSQNFHILIFKACSHPPQPHFKTHPLTLISVYLDNKISALSLKNSNNWYSLFILCKSLSFWQYSVRTTFLCPYRSTHNWPSYFSPPCSLLILFTLLILFKRLF